MKHSPTARAQRLRWQALFLAATAVFSVSRAQTSAVKAGKSVLQERYEAAQTFQAAHDLDRAAQQYRIFIADVLGELAIGDARAGSYDKAYDEFDEALHLVPAFPMLQFEYARVSLESGKLEHARRLAEGVVRSSAGDPKLAAKAHALLGRVLLAMGNSAQARPELEQAVQLDPTFDNGYNLAIAELNLGDGAAVAKLFSEMNKSFGDTAALHMLFGQAYSGSDLQADAVRELQRAISMNDRLPGAHYALASAYLATSGDTKLPEAKAELRKEIAISPDFATAFAALGHLLAQEGESTADNAEGLQFLKHATELDPTSPDAFFYRGQYYVDHKMNQEAEIYLRLSIAQTKDISRNNYQVQKAHYLLGRLLLQEDQTEKGRKEIAVSQQLRDQSLQSDRSRLADYMQQSDTTVHPEGIVSVAAPRGQEVTTDQHTEAFARQFGPAIADSYNNLGAIAGSQNTFPLALRYFERAAEWNPVLPGLDYNWGRAAIAAGTPAEAIGPLGRYLHAHPEDQGARSALGLSEFLSKDYDAARKTLKQVADMPGQTPQVQYAYADSLPQTEEAAEGVERLQRLEKAAPDVPEIHRALGGAYAAENIPAASDELRAAIRLDPHEPSARLRSQGCNSETGTLRQPSLT